MKKKNLYNNFTKNGRAYMKGWGGGGGGGLHMYMYVEEGGISKIRWYMLYSIQRCTMYIP